MATQPWVIEVKPGGWLVATVTLTADGDVSDLLEIPNWPQKTFSFTPAVTDMDLQGSNDGVVFYDLHQAHDTTLLFTNMTTAIMADIFENPRYLKITAYDEIADTVVKITAYTSR